MNLPAWIRFRFGKLQLVMVAFTLVYAILVTLNLRYIPLQWDEVNHFNGAILLIRGQFWQYVAINSFYPPLYNLVTAAYFSIAGASVFAGRLVSVTFSILSIFLVFKIAEEIYDEKTAVVSAVLFGVMPGIVWLSGLALIEMMLIFVFCVSMLFFFRWLQTEQNGYLTLSLVAFAIGVIVKYQIIVVAPIIMIVSLVITCKSKNLKTQTTKFIHSKRLGVGILLVAALATALLYAFYASGLLNVWLYAIQVGNSGQSWYSSRFSAPVFYMLEMVVPYHDKHPISLLLYGLGMAGLVFLAYRRKPQDKLLLVWFMVIYAVFTLIPNKQWRYVTPLFPVLAISATVLAASAIGFAQKIWQSTSSSLTKKRVAKFLATLLIILVAVGVFFSSLDAYSWVAQGQPQIPIAQATSYVSSVAQTNQTVLVLCAHNFFNRDMVWFYLNSKDVSQEEVYQYPELAADAYAPDFDVAELVNFCQTNGVAYIMLYEYGGTVTYYDSSLTEQAVYGMLKATGRFSLQGAFGEASQRIFVMSFE